MYFYFFLLTTFVFSESKPVFLENLDYQNKELQKLRQEISQNLELFRKRQDIQLKWRRYRIQKKDNFFVVMAKTMLNHDTLASVNRLSSLFEVHVGDEWLIPNMRGIAVFGERSELSQKYNIPPNYIFAVPGYDGLFFIAGKNFPRSERDFFRLTTFLRPIVGKLSSPFGLRKDPFSQKQKFHQGIDIACELGAPVVASQDGKVGFSGWKNGYGYTIILEHKHEYETLYAHLQRILVKPGATVKKGELIAFCGNSGRSTGPHLHFEVRRKGKRQNPNLHSV